MIDRLNAMTNCIAWILLTLAVYLCLGGSVLAQTTEFTCQGRLNDGAGPANGIYDLRFALYDDVSAGPQQGGTLTSAGTGVTNGLFTVTLDFANQFPGANRWPEIAVETYGGNGFTICKPRQALRPVPYAIFADTAGKFTAANNQLVDLSVNGTNVLQINSVYDSTSGSYTVNSPGGYSGNVISNGVVGGFIGGGGKANYPNRVGADYASVLGGLNNTTSGVMATAMGDGATATGTASTAMGAVATAGGTAATAVGYFATVSGDYSTAIGNNTTASGWVSAAKGAAAEAVHDNSFVWSDGTNVSSTAADQFKVLAMGDLQLFGGGLAVSGASSPHYAGAQGVFIESLGTCGFIFAFDYVNDNTCRSA